MEAMLAAELSTQVKGWGVTILGSLIFFGSAYVLLAAIFGRWMGYLVTAVSFWGMMIIFSLIFVFGVPGSTPPNLGPRGTRYACPTCISEPHWAPVDTAENVTSPEFDAVAQYPGGPWEAPDEETLDEVESLTNALGEFLARRANEGGEGALGQEGGQGEEGQAEDPEQEGGAGGADTGGEGTGEAHAEEEFSASDFVVQNIRFTEENGARLAAAQVFVRSGGPILEAWAVFDEGNVPLPSYIFLGVSTLAFAAHLPFLDRAERKRKDILTGGEAPKFLGPA